jgi:signal transduction histidine kinase
MIDIKIQESKEQVLITIQDYGLGMPESIRENLFDATKKTTRLGTAGERGTGFGMPIVKSYVEKLGGAHPCGFKMPRKGP